MGVGVFFCTFWGWVGQDELDLLVGGVLSQGTHDVSDLVVGHFVVTEPVEQTEGLPEVYSHRNGEGSFSLHFYFRLCILHW